MFLNKYLTLTKILVLICFFNIHAIPQTSEYHVKSVFLWRIAKYIDWPTQSKITDESKPLILSILGKDNFGKVLELVYSSRDKKIKNKIVKIQYITELSQIKGCNILYISYSERRRLDKILSYVKGKPILTVGDTKNYGKKGVHINFYSDQNKTKFELNESSAISEGFKIDYRLRNIAKIVGKRMGGNQ